MTDSYIEQQSARIHTLTASLREAYYALHNDIPSAFYNKPYGGLLTESIGAWPEYILKGTFCKHSFMGLCSPCFYSRLPITEHKKQEYWTMVQQQCMFIVDHFEENIINKQVGKTYIDNPKYSNEPCSLVLTPTGSFFDDIEFPIELRNELLKKLMGCSSCFKRDIVLHIESHVDDVLNYDTKQEASKQEIELLGQLNAKVILGFESSDEYMRNVLYNKNLMMDDFIHAINKIRDMGLSVCGFVFAGLFAANDMQTKKDVLMTVDFLLKNKVSPVLMFQNIQEYTITDMLYQNRAIKLLEPFTVLDIVSEFFNGLPSQSLYWLIADPIGGPPKPKNNIFDCAEITCRHCSDKIYHLLVKLRIDRDISHFLLESENIRKCDCYVKYKKIMEKQSTEFTDLVSSTEHLISVAENFKANYLHSFIGR
jgi:radical SAM enzyme (TIGR01210 family)